MGINENITDLKLVEAIQENINSPFFICDKSGIIISSNTLANEYFNLSQPEKSVIDLFSPHSLDLFSTFLKEADEHRSFRSDDVTLQKTDLKSFKCNIIINTINDNSHTLFLITLAIKSNSTCLNEVSKLSTPTDINIQFEDENLIEIINYITENYPFTLLDKQELSKKIEIFENKFWLKDNSDKFILVNSKLSDAIGIKKNLIENTNAIEFIPQHFRPMYKELHKYLNDTNNCSVIDNFPYPGLNSSDELFIEVPLCDSENNLIAIIGFSKKKKAIEDEESKKNQFLNEFLKTSEMCIFGINEQFILEFCNLAFEKVINEPAQKEIILKNLLNIGFKENYYNSRIEIEFEEGRQFIISPLNFAEKESKLFYYVLEEKQEISLEHIIKGKGKMLDLLIKNNPEPIFIYNKENLRFIEVNDSALELYGYSRDQFLSMDLTDLYTPEDIQTLLEDAKIVEGKFTGPYRHKKKDGTSVYVLICKANFTFNEVESHFNIVKDVTQNLHLKNKSQLFEKAFEDSDDLMLITDAEGYVIDWNKQFLSELKYNDSDISGSSFVSLVNDENRADINLKIFNNEKIEPVECDVAIKDINKNLFNCKIKAHPIIDYNNEIINFLFIIKLNNHKSAEKVSNKEPEQIVINNSTYPTPLNKEYFSYIFHEILTPINVILGFVQEITESIKKPDNDQKEAIDIINQNNKQLLNSLNSIIEFTSLMSEKIVISKEEFLIQDLLAPIKKEFHEFENMFDSKFEIVKIPKDIKIKNDREKLYKFIDVTLKIIGQISTGQKTIISAYSSKNNFIISFRSTNQNLPDLMSEVFRGEEQNIRKNYGVSKLALKLANFLLVVLNGKFIKDVDKNVSEFGFEFPKDISTGNSSTKFMSVVNDNSELKEELFDDLPSDFIESNSEIKEVKQASKKYIRFKEDREDIKDKKENIPKNEISRNTLSQEIKSSNYTPVSEVIRSRTNKKNNLDLGKLSCLYIEDQIDSQMLFRNQLKGLKTLDFAVSFEEALPLLEEKNFDVIVIDINLQGEYNGLDSLKLIHRMSKYENVPVIAVTAYVLPGDKDKFIAAGFDDFISKPIFRTKMLDSLNKVL